VLLVTAVFGGLMLLSAESAAGDYNPIDWRNHDTGDLAGASPSSAFLPAVRHSGGARHHHGDNRKLAESNQQRCSERFFRLFQQTVWPPGKISLAKSQIPSIIMQFLGVLQSIMSINPHTATLPHPVALENVIRDRSTADISSVRRPTSAPSGRFLKPAHRSPGPRPDGHGRRHGARQPDDVEGIRPGTRLQLQLANQIESLVANPNINISPPGRRR